MKLLSLSLVSILIALSVASAENKQLTLLGKRTVTIVSSKVTVGDLADLQDISNKEFADRISGIAVGRPLSAGEELTIEASAIVQALNENGINLREIGYVFPKNIAVSRAARLITLAEVKDAIQGTLSKSGRSLTVTEVDYKEPVKVAPGLANIDAKMTSRNKGKMTFGITVRVEGEALTSFNVAATVSDWADVPVASRPLKRGEVIQSSDLQMARVNLEVLGNDVEIREDLLLGKELKNAVSAGDTFKYFSVKVPPVVLASSKVSVVYESGALKAIATGVALEAGIAGQVIKVQNDASKKVIMARVVEPGLVKVETEVLR